MLGPDPHRKPTVSLPCFAPVVMVYVMVININTAQFYNHSLLQIWWQINIGMWLVLMIFSWQITLVIWTGLRVENDVLGCKREKECLLYKERFYCDCTSWNIVREEKRLQKKILRRLSLSRVYTERKGSERNTLCGLMCLVEVQLLKATDKVQVCVYGITLLRSDRESHNSKHTDMCPLFLTQSSHSNSQAFISPQNPQVTEYKMTSRSYILL